MSIYTSLIMVMLLAMAFNKDRLLMFTLIVYVVSMLIEAMSNNVQTLEVKIMCTIILVMFCWLSFKSVREE